MAETERWVIAGLGNPGRQYAANRHNVGFMVVDALCEAAKLSWKSSSRFQGEIAIGELSKRPVVLVKPQTYMNLSGRSVGPLAHFYRVPAERVIAIHDEVDFELGRLKVKQGGGEGGHNGLRSLTECLGSADYMRVRVGVGRPKYGEVADYVLSDFRDEEQDAVDKLLRQAAKATRTLLTRGLAEAMNRFNRNPKPKRPKPKPETAADEAEGAASDSGRATSDAERDAALATAAAAGEKP